MLNSFQHLVLSMTYETLKQVQGDTDITSWQFVFRKDAVSGIRHYSIRTGSIARPAISAELS